MAQFRTRPATVEAIIFDELVDYGKANGANIVNGMPWSFTYKGLPVTHENDDLYLLGAMADMRFRRGDMLITNSKGQTYPYPAALFEKIYEPSR